MPQQLPRFADIHKPYGEPGHEPGAYGELLSTFIDRGFDFVLFHNLDQRQGAQVILRHDIDFDTQSALHMAQVEASFGIRATYFFLMRSKMYNLLSPKDSANVKAIQELGHEVSLHFDHTPYKDLEAGLAHEAAMFESCFRTAVRIFSFHRPDKKLIRDHREPIEGIENAYQNKYFRDIKYMSDSTGKWRFGHPFDTREFAERRNIQLLIHPIWWMLKGENNMAKLDTYIADRALELRKDIALNCIPFLQKVNAVEVV